MAQMLLPSSATAGSQVGIASALGGSGLGIFSRDDRGMGRSRGLSVDWTVVGPLSRDRIVYR